MELNYLSNLSQAEDRILVQTDILSEQTLYEIVKVIFHEKSKWAMVIRSILIIITFYMIKKATAIKTQNGLATVGHHSNIFYNILKVGQWHNFKRVINVWRQLTSCLLTCQLTFHCAPELGSTSVNLVYPGELRSSRYGDFLSEPFFIELLAKYLRKTWKPSIPPFPLSGRGCHINRRLRNPWHR